MKQLQPGAQQSCHHRPQATQIAKVHYVQTPLVRQHRLGGYHRSLPVSDHRQAVGEDDVLERRIGFWQQGRSVFCQSVQQHNPGGQIGTLDGPFCGPEHLGRGIDAPKQGTGIGCGDFCQIARGTAADFENSFAWSGV